MTRPSPGESPDASLALTATLLKGLRKTCPRCGQGRLFSGWLTLRERCEACGLLYQTDAGETWAFVYLSTAGMTGVMVIGMLLIRPQSLLVGNFVLIAIATAVIVLTLPYRKGAAVALAYWLDPDR